MPSENGNNGKTEELSERDFTKLNLEYQECVSSSRFHVGIRFSYFVSFSAIFFVLIATFHFVWTSKATELEPLKPGIMLAIAVFDFITAGIAIIIEIRTYQIFRTADKRVGFLEERMGIKDGIRQIYARRVTPKRFLGIPLTHTVEIGVFYGVVTFIWILLFLFSLYEILF